MQVKNIELAQFRKTSLIQYGYIATAHFHKALVSKLLQHAIDVNDGDPKRIADVPLSNRKMKGVASGPTDRRA